MPAATKLYSLEREVPLPRSRVWELLGNTDHLNRALGLAPVDFKDVAAADTTLVREGQASMLGFPMRWKEYPFQWVNQQSYSVLRVYSAGPLERFLGGIELHDAGSGTRLRCFAELSPRGLAGAVAGPIIAQRLLRKTFEYCDRYLTLMEAAPQPRLPQPSFNTPADVAQLQFMLRKLQQIPTLQPDHINRLGAFISEAGDEEVAAIRPYQLADDWGVDRDDMLRLCLHATRSGLLNLSWNMMCPNCRVPKVTVGSLSQVTDQLHCDVCEVSYDTNFDRYVELRFTVHPSVRSVVARTYCIGGPFLAPHILVQQRVEPGQTNQFTWPRDDNELRLRVLRSNAVAAMLQGGEPDIRYAGDEWSAAAAGTDGPGSSINVTNANVEGIVVALEKVAWDATAVTAYQVTTLPEFRNMFGSEVLAPGQYVGVEHLTLLFSDLHNSTALYETIGDAPAYGSVRRHFDYMFERIERYQGSVVKTIGDAVMAVFLRPEDALRAALDIQQELASLNRSLGADDTIVIKMGLHHGPAIAVNSNDRLDYFGRTVNIAARIGAACAGHQIVISEACFEYDGVQHVLREQQAEVTVFQANLKGIEEMFTLHRVVPGKRRFLVRLK